MRNQYVFILTLLALGFGYGAFEFATADEGNTYTLVNAAPHAPGAIPAAPALDETTTQVPEARITLRRDNTVVFRAIVDPLSVAKTQKELLDKSNKLKKGEPIYLFLDTPGGDINSGAQLTAMARGIGRPVHTITLYAASMGFNIAQRLDTRYVMEAGLYMAHRARVDGVGGQIPGNFLTAVSTLLTGVREMENQNAARLGISYEKYAALVADEYYVTGAEAVKQGVADSLVAVSCDSSLSGSHDEEFRTFFGAITLTWADCPAITGPLGMKAEKSQTLDFLADRASMWHVLSGKQP